MLLSRLAHSALPASLRASAASSASSQLHAVPRVASAAPRAPSHVAQYSNGSAVSQTDLLRSCGFAWSFGGMKPAGWALRLGFSRRWSLHILNATKHWEVMGRSPLAG